MSIHVALHHRTSYHYDRLITLGPQTVRLRPAPHCRSRILSYSLKVLPDPHFTNWQQDPQSNYVARLVFPERTQEFSIEVDLIVEMAAVNPFDFFLEPSAEQWPFNYDRDLREELAPYLRIAPNLPRLDAYVAAILRDAPEKSLTNSFLVGLNQRLCKEIEYKVRLEPGLQTPDETLEKASGSCRDSGWLLVQMLRRLGLAARFTSGYLVQLAADVKPIEGPAGPQTDFVDLHAWCEVYLPGAGWIGFDPTSGLLAGEGHLPLACTAEPGLAAPVSGLVEKCEATFDHEMRVTRVLEVPRVTKPYTEAQWEAIVEVGRAIDRELTAGDVRLTMGGEPTFVSEDDPDGEEWNTAALGPNKKRLAADLFRRLQDRYAPRGLAHFGQGKWYPGEPLPRWALNLFWRRDGEPLWNDRALVADESAPTGADEAQAGCLIRSIAARLGVDDGAIFPAYEDVYYYLWRERRLPINVDPFTSKLDDPLERDRLRRIFSTGLDQVVGHGLPIARSLDGIWMSAPWVFRMRRCYLIPGDSPMGFRLPLDARPWVAPEGRDALFTADPAQPMPPLAPHAALWQEQADRWRQHGEAAPRMQRPGSSSSGPDGGAFDGGDGAAHPGARAGWSPSGALCVEPRGGVMYVFMPPLGTLDDYAALIAAVEGAAGEVGVPVIIEGYPPPRDARLVQLSVTPDPGVIEVNIHPASSWDQLCDHTTHLYEAARLSRLGAEKFMLDGRHSGTGGGNHVVLGGATSTDSPFLRRPDLLRSLVGYFHQHPSLSYLFSGLFIGPTSQAPRVDEARNDALFELEIAFREVTRKAAGQPEAPPWLVDRVFRDVLVDVTGNTHRAEFCIDKLFSPDSASGRLGLVELRALEMPPHARMSLAQQLLLRALVARFWKTPYAPERLARWDTELHDRFMLPFFVWQDFEDVLTELRESGYPFDDAWFHPHFEFRFPKYGDFAARGVEIDLRGALEPWHVLGEDATAGGTARYVDSSLERLQVRASGMAPDRYALTCNGVTVPLQPTGTEGEFVAGVRYRAWRPPRCLHPNIGVHAPLVFDLVDLWMQRSLGGCEYHVSHPGGRSHDTRPVNALEAEGRRRARFFRMGHTPGKLSPEPAPANPDFPFTLDLRRAQ